MNFAIMNNTPFHFLIAGVVLALFLTAVFTKNEDTKNKLIQAMKILFVFVVLSGCAVWFMVPFSLPLLVKSLGGFVLFWTMLQIVKEPKNVPFWGLFVGIAGVGLFLAFFMI